MSHFSLASAEFLDPEAALLILNEFKSIETPHFVKHNDASVGLAWEA